MLVVNGQQIVNIHTFCHDDWTGLFMAIHIGYCPRKYLFIRLLDYRFVKKKIDRKDSNIVVTLTRLIEVTKLQFYCMKFRSKVGK